MIDALFAPFDEQNKMSEEKMNIDPPSGSPQNEKNDQIQQQNKTDQSCEPCEPRKKSKRKCVFCPDKHRKKLCDSVVLKKNTPMKKKKSTSEVKTVKNMIKKMKKM